MTLHPHPHPTLEGQDAARRGEPMSACPYSPSSPDGRRWLAAWVQAEHHRQQMSGESARRTAEQRAEAHRLAAQWEPARYAPNPVDDLCREVAEAGESGERPGFMDMARQACRDAGLDPDAPVYQRQPKVARVPPWPCDPWDPRDQANGKTMVWTWACSWSAAMPVLPDPTSITSITSIA